MLPEALASVTLRRKDSFENAGNFSLPSPSFNIGEWKETRFAFTASAQCNVVMSL